MATRSYRSEIEALIPTLRQCARALISDARGDGADDLVHDVLTHALRTERGWMGEDVASRVFARLIGANRLRLRSEIAEQRSVPGGPAQPGAAAAGRATIGHDHHAAHTVENRSDRALEVLALNEREAIVVVVLGQLDYPQAAQALGIPVGVLVTRVTHAREKLGQTLWTTPNRGLSLADSSGRRTRSASHLRVVK